MDILGENAQGLVDAYAAECSIPVLGKVNPQRDIYSALEQSDSSRCFGVYEGDELVGFANVLASIIPHYGKKVAVVESLYLSPSHRHGWNGRELMAAIESDAKESGCVAILYSAPVDGKLFRLLSLSLEYSFTNAVFCRSLATDAESLTYRCAVTAPPGKVYPGDVVTVTGRSEGIRDYAQARYSWCSDAGSVSSEGSIAIIDTLDLAPGIYTVKGHVSEGVREADCATTFEVSAVGSLA